MPTRLQLDTEFAAIKVYLTANLALASDARYPQLRLGTVPPDGETRNIDGSTKPADRAESLNDALGVVLNRASFLAAAVDEYSGPYGLGAFLRCRYLTAGGQLFEQGEVLTGTDPAFTDYTWTEVLTE